MPFIRSVCSDVASAFFAIGVILYAEGGGFEHTGNIPYSPVIALQCITALISASAVGFLF